MSNVKQAANFLLSARFNQNIIDNIPPSLYPSSKSDAYLVQERVLSGLIERNDSMLVGYKLACTNQPVMDLLGVDEPFFGCLLLHTTFEDKVRLEASNFVKRVVESEFVFVMGEDLPQTDVPYTAKTIKSFISTFVPAIEIVDHRYADFTVVGGNALIADNAIHGASILGKADDRDWQAFKLDEQAVTLLVNGRVQETGTGANVLGSPLNAMAWLGNCLQSQGRQLKAGDIVTTGTACAVYNAAAGDDITVNFGEMGSVSMSFI